VANGIRSLVKDRRNNKERKNKAGACSQYKEKDHQGYQRRLMSTTTLIVVCTIIPLLLSGFLNHFAHKTWILYFPLFGFALSILYFGHLAIRSYQSPASAAAVVEPSPLGGRPRFSEEVDTVTLIVGSSTMTFDHMARGRTVDFIGVPNSSVATAKVVNDELLVDAKLGAEGMELKNNRLTKRPAGWDWQADENTFEIVNNFGNPVFQLIYKNSTTASVRGVFFDEVQGRCVLVNEEDIVLAHATAADVATFKIKPIFKYPSWKHPKERQ
jgi:hypothetical protein